VESHMNTNSSAAGAADSDSNSNPNSDSSSGSESAAIEIVYDVTPGSRHRIGGVYFSGNRDVGDATLKSVVSVKKGESLFGHVFSRGKFSDDLLRKSTQAIQTLYKDRGFAGVDVKASVHDYDPNVDITFNIVEGPQNKVKSLRIVDAHQKRRQKPHRRRLPRQGISKRPASIDGNAFR
jgi:outer membrane protein assembly factor BamA